MNILDLAVSTKSFKLVLRHPETHKNIELEDGSLMSINIFSSDTSTSRAAIEKAKRATRELLSNLKKGEKLSEEDTKLLMPTAISESCESFNLGTDVDNNKFIELLANPSFFWMYDQITQNMDARGNFMMSKPKASKPTRKK